MLEKRVPPPTFRPSLPSLTIFSCVFHSHSLKPSIQWYFSLKYPCFDPIQDTNDVSTCCCPCWPVLRHVQLHYRMIWCFLSFHIKRHPNVLVQNRRSPQNQVWINHRYFTRRQTNLWLPRVSNYDGLRWTSWRWQKSWTSDLGIPSKQAHYRLGRKSQGYRLWRIISSGLTRPIGQMVVKSTVIIFKRHGLLHFYCCKRPVKFSSLSNSLVSNFHPVN